MKAALYTTKSSLDHLTAVYNGIAGVKMIKKFSCSKAEAIAKIEKALAAVPKEKSVGATHGEKKGPGPRTGVCSLMAQLFSEGLSPKDVFAKIQEQLPEARTSLRAVYWYSSYLRRQSAA